jgi:hypothetical protein
MELINYLVSQLINCRMRCEAPAEARGSDNVLAVRACNTPHMYVHGSLVVEDWQGKALKEFCPYHFVVRLSIANDRCNEYWGILCCKER